MPETKSDLLADYLTEDELAQQLHRTSRNLRQWRRANSGPPATKIGNTVYYNRESVREWLRQREGAAA